MTHECVLELLKLSSNVHECKPIPPGLDYHAITTLRMEAGSRLYAHTVPPKLYTLAASIQGLKEVIPKP